MTVDFWARRDRETWTGFSWTGPGTRPRVKIQLAPGKGVRWISFAEDTDPQAMLAARDLAKHEAAVDAAKNPQTRALSGDFAFDAKRYLAQETIRRMPIYKKRVGQIAVWVKLLGTTKRSTITTTDIDGLKKRLAATPRRAFVDTTVKHRFADQDHLPFAAGTVNLLLRALSNVWKVLDGARAPNPVRGVKELAEPKPTKRGLPDAAVTGLISQMPDPDPAKTSKKAEAARRNKVLIRCFAYAGIEDTAIRKVKPEDLDLVKGTLHFPARGKGAGAQDVVLPLLPAAIAAFEDFDRLRLYGAFPKGSLQRAFKQAVRRAGLPSTTRIKDLRHSFLSAIYRATRNLDLVAKFGQHAATETSKFYVQAVEEEVLADTKDQVAAIYGGARAAFVPLDDDARAAGVVQAAKGHVLKAGRSSCTMEGVQGGKLLTNLDPFETSKSSNLTEEAVKALALIVGK